ncbi:unnamed protein product [Lampetra planeri]
MHAAGNAAAAAAPTAVASDLESRSRNKTKRRSRAIAHAALDPSLRHHGTREDFGRLPWVLAVARKAQARRLELASRAMRNPATRVRIDARGRTPPSSSSSGPVRLISGLPVVLYTLRRGAMGERLLRSQRCLFAVLVLGGQWQESRGAVGKAAPVASSAASEERIGDV